MERDSQSPGYPTVPCVRGTKRGRAFSHKYDEEDEENQEAAKKRCKAEHEATKTPEEAGETRKSNEAKQENLEDQVSTGVPSTCDKTSTPDITSNDGNINTEDSLAIEIEMGWGPCDKQDSGVRERERSKY